MTLHKVLVGALLLVFGCLCTAQKVELKTVPIKHVDPSSGGKMYVTYCAVCHGTDGKGVGPATPALKTPPSDLTTLAKRNGGKYPALQVVQKIKGDVALPAHGDKNMPIWGPAFRSLHAGADPSVDPDVQMRITNLTNYIESLQR